MEYIIAEFRVRTSGPHADLAEIGLRGFKPFEVEPQAECEADAEFQFGCALVHEEYAPTRHLYHFDFDEDYGTCELERTERGYRFLMKRTGGASYLLVKEDNSPVIRTDFGADGTPDITLLRFGLWVMFGLTIAPKGGIPIHSSAIVKDEAAVLCLGESGTGKSTHTRLWREHIEGARLLNDDSPIIRMVDGVATVFGSPWSGKTHCYINRSFPIRGFMRLSQAPHNKIRRLGVLNAIGALLPSCPPAFAHDEALEDAVCNTLSDMISSVAVYHLECLPDAAAANLSYSTIYGRRDL